ncbi:MAG: hypothetical protein ACK4NX_03180 [Candidatus Paceibacteria bacterium]
MPSIVERILEVLQDRAEATVDLLSEIAQISFSSYPTSYRKARMGFRYGGKRTFRFKSNWAAAYRNRQLFYSRLNQLKRQGFISKHKYKGITKWKITKKGQEKLASIRLNPRISFKGVHKIVGDGKMKIVAFDIPENERYKRAWLRYALATLGFSMLQKSLWVGKKNLPDDFLWELRKRNMIEYVHIFEITKTGTIAKLI